MAFAWNYCDRPHEDWAVSLTYQPGRKACCLLLEDFGTKGRKVRLPNQTKVPGFSHKGAAFHTPLEFISYADVFPLEDIPPRLSLRRLLVALKYGCVRKAFSHPPSLQDGISKGDRETLNIRKIHLFIS